MATKSHSYSLRARANGAVVQRSSCSVEVPATQQQASFTRETPIKSVQELRSSHRKFSVKTGNNLSEKKFKKGGNKGTVSMSTTSTANKRSSDELSDIEDIQLVGPSFSVEECVSIRSSLLNWYDACQRVLPWRENSHSCHNFSTDSDKVFGHKNDVGKGVEIASQCTTNCDSSTGMRPEIELEEWKDTSKKDPQILEELSREQRRAYQVWVSELMLQQTRVSTVVEYYRRWMERWPTLHHLAQASQEAVNSMWAGLGYYRRARFLLEGAKHIEETCGGVFPDTLSALRQLHGIGNYTAGAIASIAFKKAVPVVDGNVVRVLCRLRAISDSPKLSSTVKLLWALAEQLVDPRRPGDLNQAIMELGATVCTPTSPSCSSCPIASHCKALSLASPHSGKSVSKSVTDFPLKVRKVPPREEFVAVCIVEVCTDVISTLHSSLGDNRHVLLIQRPQAGLLAGLWEFPSISLGKEEVSDKKQRAAMDLFLTEILGLNLDGSMAEVKRRKNLGTYRHVFSHIRMQMSVEWLLLCLPSDDRREMMQKSILDRRGNASPIKWVATDSLSQLGLTTSVRKIFLMYLDHIKMEEEKEIDKRTRKQSQKRVKK